MPPYEQHKKTNVPSYIIEIYGFINIYFSNVTLKQTNYPCLLQKIHTGLLLKDNTHIHCILEKKCLLYYVLTKRIDMRTQFKGSAH